MTTTIIAVCCVLGLAAINLVAARDILKLFMTGKISLDAVVVSAKAWCFITIGFFTPLTVGLAQWANSGQWPGAIIWVITGASCMVGAASQLLSFLSGSYSDYVAGRKNVTPPLTPKVDSPNVAKNEPPK